jgi:hypothetical protein
MKETYTQLDAVSVRPFVIFFISSILSILCGLFFRSGGGGGERVAEWQHTDTVCYTCKLHLHLPHCSVRYTVKITAGCESDFA